MGGTEWLHKDSDAKITSLLCTSDMCIVGNFDGRSMFSLYLFFGGGGEEQC